MSPPLTPNNIPDMTLEWGRQSETIVRAPQPAATQQTDSVAHPGGVSNVVPESEDRAHDKDSLVLPDHSAILQVSR